MCVQGTSIGVYHVCHGWGACTCVQGTSIGMYHMCHGWGGVHVCTGDQYWRVPHVPWMGGPCTCVYRGPVLACATDGGACMCVQGTSIGVHHVRHGWGGRARVCTGDQYWRVPLMGGACMCVQGTSIGVHHVRHGWGGRARVCTGDQYWRVPRMGGVHVCTGDQYWRAPRAPRMGGPCTCVYRGPVLACAVDGGACTCVQGTSIGVHHVCHGWGGVHVCTRDQYWRVPRMRGACTYVYRGPVLACTTCATDGGAYGGPVLYEGINTRSIVGLQPPQQSDEVLGRCSGSTASVGEEETVTCSDARPLVSCGSFAVV
ncbi:hypothetical protein NDU88_000288 [Pleurodeles waltl]|uniref:Uncharacterized protein n=1 Tax=Pleurodeles waltl TaxID=8319 RepID=A0AAV7LZU0_PLEWA|nr:hypothetical protein NDU88_000288 [Pleurodeles waltl]